MLYHELFSIIMDYSTLDVKKRIVLLNKYYNKLNITLYETYIFDNNYINLLSNDTKQLIKRVKNIYNMDDIKHYPNIKSITNYLDERYINFNISECITSLIMTKNDINNLKNYPNLKNLEIHKHITDFSILPKNLKNLIIYNHIFNEPLINLPEELESLTIFSISFDQEIDCNLLPKNLKKLIIKNFNYSKKIINVNNNISIIYSLMF